jgi:hypothetical protein
MNYVITVLNAKNALKIANSAPMTRSALVAPMAIIWLIQHSRCTPTIIHLNNKTKLPLNPTIVLLSANSMNLLIMSLDFVNNVPVNVLMDVLMLKHAKVVITVCSQVYIFRVLA